MKNKMWKVLATATTFSILAGCAGYDQWAEDTNRKINSGWTELLNGKQTVDTSALPKGMTVNISYGKGEGSGLPGRASSKFYDKLLGDLTYDKSCKTGLMLNVAMFNDAGGMIRNEPIAIGPYVAGTKALINKDVITDPLMQKSSQVTRLVLSNVRCV
ncbi:MAG: hypothetical protein FWD62_02855 [Betaproteobacteria bacterium]|nr:hypothetical protein [Betaproteobacteria bacterium]